MLFLRHRLLVVSLLPIAARGYFQVTYPIKGSQVAEGQPFPVTWSKGLLDGVSLFDLELTRMSTDGLILIARNVSSSSGGINIALNSVPPGDDYFFLFINSVHGLMYANSQMFSIANSGTGNSSTVPQPLPSKPTVTVSGGLNPTAQFATTFPVLANGVRPWRPSHAALLSMCLLSLALLTGAAAVL
ncbi:hypothetical protein F5148DRAFT_1167447 [Russula earlei]|uniref:Uncharacterized protein n=1 Tax=Russula earlei TaxID=71964 RepID=A0ACC0UJU6_9AGAM|nr:hypothetical protein F5148DRAFT_1167447 [Russula earlei]